MLGGGLASGGREAPDSRVRHSSMRGAAIVAVALILGFATSCTDTSADNEDLPSGKAPTRGQAQGVPQPVLVEPILDDAASAGVLAVRFRYAQRTSVYAEGARHYLQVSRPDGTVVVRRDEGTEQGPGAGYMDTVRLQPGRYRVQTFQRGCDYTQGGDCQRVLDPPTHQCTAPVVIRAEAATTVAITVSLPNPCTVIMTDPQ